MRNWLKEQRLQAAWQDARSPVHAPHDALARLRVVREDMRADPDWWGDHWLELVDQHVAPGRVELLDEADFAAFAQMADVLTDFEDAPVEDIGWRIVAARSRRGEDVQAVDALVALHDRPDARAEHRRAVALELVRRRAGGERVLAIYARHLREERERAEPDVRMRVEWLLDIDLSSPPDSRTRAARLVAELGHAAADLPLALRVLGIQALLEREDPSAAAGELALAVRADPDDGDAHALLVVALLAAGDAAAALAELDTSGRDPLRLRGLAETLHWLDDVGTAAPRPAWTAADLRGLALPDCLALARGGAVGRLLLVEGDAAGAAAVLTDLVQRSPAEPRFAYHAAWAQLLAGGRPSTRASARWPAGWTVASLLGAEPADATVLTHGQARVLAARQALAAGRRPEPVHWSTGSGQAEEELEAVRVTIAVALHDRDVDTARLAVRSPAFERLPLADQTHWQGLLALADARTTEGVGLLAQATRRGSPHAPVALCAHHLRRGAAAAAAELLEGPLAVRDEPHVALLRAYAGAAEQRFGEASGPLRTLVERGFGPAGYALADVLAAEAIAAARGGERERSARLWNEAATAADAALTLAAASGQPLPDDALTLAAALRLAAGPDSDRAAVLREDAGDRTRREWVAWHAAVARLWTASTPQALDAAGELVRRIEEAAPDACGEAAAAVARQLAKLALADRAHARTALALLDRLAAHTRSAQVRGARAMAGGDGAGGATAVLVAAREALAGADPTRAAELLRTAEPGDDRVARACATLSAVLAGTAPVLDEHDATAGAGAGAGPWAVLAALEAFAAGSMERGAQTILRTLDESPAAVTGAVRVDALLGPLCARSGRGDPPPALAAAVERLAHGAVQPATAAAAARCAAQLGATDMALSAYSRAGQLGAVDPETTREHVAYLCHLAALAGARGDELGAADRLGVAASVAAGAHA